MTVLAIAFFAFSTAVFLALYWHQLSKNEALKLNNRLECIERDGYEHFRAMDAQLQETERRLSRDIEHIHWKLGECESSCHKTSSKPR